MVDIGDGIEIDGDRYLSRPAAAKLLRRSWRTLRRWAIDGYGPRPTNVGLTPYYRLSEIHDWLQNFGKRQPGRPRKVRA